jgi:hypothetical protein
LQLDGACWIEKSHVIVPHIADSVADLPSAHAFGWVGSKQIDGRPCQVSCIEPAIEVLLVQDDRHPVVDWLHHLVGIGSEYGEGLQRLAVLRAPTFPEAGKRVGFAAF